ncbi:hypothetical protein PspR32_15005 [Pseudomonas sp. R32]|uniref:Helix-turn-helix domain-containing protein n=2 Tax=Pseudomonas TaxID=286 RepID=A0AAP0SIW2_9PSED|nr:helix-turn-helix domain-containing protein [Pseudomonas donghuensis]MBS7601531.1 helix-turn-helix domain-containing protein [Pseudomonas sp. RC2C2]QHF29044.1 hypothetical protein PspR32_15005 [Pseudomonas sp. R32]
MCIECQKAVRIVPAMDKWTDLVKARMRELKVTQENLAERIGVTQGAVGHWLREEREPKLKVLNQILVEVGLPPLQMVSPHQVAENHGSYTVSGNPTTVTGADGLQHDLYFRYPILSWGNLDPIEVGEDCALQSTDYKAQGRAFWLKVEGDAMTAPLGVSVPEGMLILVDTALPGEPGKLVIARSPDSKAPRFRQLIEEGGQRYLRPLNPTYPKVLCTEQCEMLGVVVQALVKF